MSATVDAAPLKDYFGGDAAVIDVPGRTFPVAVKFLEDAVRALPAFDVAIGGAGARAAPRPEASSLTPARAAATAATEAEEAAAAAAAANASGAATLAARAAKLRRAADAFPAGACGRAGDDWLEGLGAAGARAELGRAGDVLRKLDLGARVNEPLIAALVTRWNEPAWPNALRTSVQSKGSAARRTRPPYSTQSRGRVAKTWARSSPGQSPASGGTGCP